MKKRTKLAGQYYKYYASGISMARWKTRPVTVTANSLVNILKIRSRGNDVLCQYKDDILLIPIDNFRGDSLAVKNIEPKLNAKRKKILVKLSTQAIVEAEVAGATQATGDEPVAETPAQTPVAEVPEAAPVNETPVVVTAEPVLA